MALAYLRASVLPPGSQLSDKSRIEYGSYISPASYRHLPADLVSVRNVVTVTKGQDAVIQWCPLMVAPSRKRGMGSEGAFGVPNGVPDGIPKTCWR